MHIFREQLSIFECSSFPFDFEVGCGILVYQFLIIAVLLTFLSSRAKWKLQNKLYIIKLHVAVMCHSRVSDCSNIKLNESESQTGTISL